ncbi:DUF4249 domain-containing protein [Dinghuibacter silviterrae]|uniref:Uncharacterized protein DUF4249 n=1 Tax=Dinghuibacter silviterrae TaxID=1539049 RepID=A0A4V3GLK6_9BACT|nr:DUF4249 domain-containing protein [Dinghuibacter silviterrae]TDW99912.1 uncharacterized protein DUF4249 [Dinghuibacter silviterrae]
MMRYLFLFCICLASCQKVITLPLKSVPPELDIQGDVTNLPGPYTVSLSQSVDFYADNVYPTVSGAVIKITDSTSGVTDSLTETAPGVYSTHLLQGVPGHTYGLYVLSGGNTYTASSTMPAPVPLDSVTFSTNKRGGKSVIQPIPNFQDPAGIHNYYQFVVYVNGVQLQSTFVFDDRLSDGRYIHRALGTDTSQILPGDQVLVNMYCIDANNYTYFDEVEQITDPGQQSQDASPANPQSNIIGGSLGYFSAHTVSGKTAVAP